MKNIDQQIEQTRRTVAQNPESLELKASFLRLRMQAGQIEPETIKYCSSLGDPICRMFFPKQPEMGVEQVLGEISDKRFSVGFAIYCAEKVLPIFEEQYNAADAAARALRGETTDNQLLIEYLMLGDNID